MRKKLRKLGDILLDMEVLLEEITDAHELQMGDILALTKAWVEIHRPESIEKYLDGSIPVYFYGHKDNK